MVTACAGGHKPGSGSAGTGTSGGKTGSPYYKVGQPYQIGGNWYYPKEDYSYDETGIASWYGADFHGQKTANGEVFNKNELTAAHKTLPLPSLARVTNLDNGRSIVVRINDRGPFSGARVIDMTQRASQLLGFEKQGTAKVRVQVMADESRAIADAMRHYGTGPAPVSVVAAASEPPLSSAPLTSVISQPLEPFVPVASSPVAMTPEPQAPLPSKAQAHAMMATFQPAPIVRQLPITGPHQIFVQAGAFTKLENANKLKQNLAKVGSVSVAEAVVKGTQYYRVRIGPIPDVASADILLKKVVQGGVANARTVVD